MDLETYTPGHTLNASDFMSRRTLDSHGGFFLPHLQSGLSVLDCGCGPGTITVGIAAQVAPGEVIGIDLGQSQIDRAIANASQAGLTNTTFQTASCYNLSFHEAQFDRIFSHALMEHLKEPVRALQELHCVLKPGGIIGLCSPDWGGFILSPISPELTLAMGAYMSLQGRNGGDVLAGRKLGQYLVTAGFHSIQMSARYEVYPSLALIGEYLALQLERADDPQSADVFRNWSQQEGGMFAQSWVSAIGFK